jgi:hypothetical protein
MKPAFQESKHNRSAVPKEQLKVTNSVPEIPINNLAEGN